ncbi:MAG: UvrD-helicase domain-containing protein [Candidatus Pacebacteria bacterium]|jgi:DNA helicase-2/ATP-dependent DNA helicase PcrA|nr:UvrD-helicase domain-containing protein [Candidatus Paceibacterota bacterium]
MALDLNKLNKEQKQAVEHDGGPLLVVAGAGTGKTRAITHRIGWLVEKKLAKPEEILALTFTDKASGEMEDRVDDLLSLGYADLWICTFHSFCERVLRQNGIDIGISGNFKLADETAAWILVRQNIDRFKLKYYKPLGNPTKFIHALLNHFSRCKDQGIMPADYLKYAKGNIDEKEKVREVARAYQVYQALLLENNLLDFGDLLHYCVRLFQKRPAILTKYRRKFKYILVDEFQDTNWIQYELVKLLAAPKNNLTVCADDDQAIYRWRGASFGNIIQFKKDFPDAAQAVLVRNYRSCQNILDTAYKFIQANNPNRLECLSKIDKRLVASHECKGDIRHLHFKTVEQEVQGVVNEIIRLAKEEKEAKFSDFAILLRANDSAAAFSRACERSGVPAQFLAAKGLYSKQAVLDIISYLKLLDNYHANDAMWRVLNMPFLMIPSLDIVKITQYSSKKSQSLWDSLQASKDISGLSEHAVAGIAKLMEMTEKHAKMAREKNVSELALVFLEDSGYLEHLVRTDRRSEIEYIGQFYDKIKAFEEANVDPNLQKFVEELNMELESGEEGKLSFDPAQAADAVQIMTVHSAKGLEFEHVFLASLVDRKFPVTERGEEIEIPAALAKETPYEGDAHLEEERRLFYVAMTRARRGLYFTSATDYGGVRPKKLSRFLAELGYNGDNHQAQVQTVRVTGNYRPLPKQIIFPSHFSFTQLATFEKCPMQYKFSHILKVPTRGKAFFSYGRTMHNSLYEFLMELGDKKGSFKRLADLYERNWIDEWYDGKSEKEAYYRQGLASLKSFWKDFSARRPKIMMLNNAPALEQEFNLKISGFAVTGKIDRIDVGQKGVEIIDYKTGTAKDKLRPEDKMQLMMYQMAAKEVFDLDTEKLTYFYLDKASPLSFSPKGDEIVKHREKIAQIIDDLVHSDFRATPGWQCEWCDYKNMCEFAKKH